MLFLVFLRSHLLSAGVYNANVRNTSSMSSRPWLTDIADGFGTSTRCLQHGNLVSEPRPFDARLVSDLIFHKEQESPIVPCMRCFFSISSLTSSITSFNVWMLFKHAFLPDLVQ